MTRRTPTIDPELRAHQEWLGYLQPVGLVVAPAAMVDAGWVVTRSGSELIERQERYREAIQSLSSASDSADPDPEADGDTRTRGFPQIETLLVEHLGWSADQIQTEPAQIESYSRHLPELGETLRPTALVPAAHGEGIQLLLQALPSLAPLDQKGSSGEHLWRATSQERFERLLRETGVEAGLLFNGAQLRLVVAPKGESSGHLTFPLAELGEVGGRLMFAALELLLGQSHVFLDPDGYRLTDVLRKSRSFQAVVSNALADQVLAALWDLLRGFQRADELSQRQDVELLADLPERDPQQLYGGLITVLMRLVFLLYAEDEALMPADAVYEQNYKVSGIFERLRQDAADYPDTMEQRYGAWAGLMSLCRLVYAGGGATTGYLPARKGQLFDPKAYRWLEAPWISDGVVLSVLSNLLVVKGERISYRALDVEQIGSVYEGIMGYAVRRIPGRCIGLKSKPQGAKKQLTTAVDLDALLELAGGKRKTWLEAETGTTLPPKAATALRDAGSEAELLEALAPRIDKALFDGPQAAGGLVFQPTEERRRSGSHYTPRALTRPIVEEALRPWLERCNHQPTAAQILDLKICDPAMGSGAFLVESCRYLAELLELAWSREGLPEALKPDGSAHGEEPLLYARRLIAQSCLYGVDKNPFAVNLARLSLWLVSLSKNAPFTFVDHALKCGDSLVGYGVREIKTAIQEVQLGFLNQQNQVFAQMGMNRRESFANDSRNDMAYDLKQKQLDQQIKASEGLRTAGDLMVAAFFAGSKPKERADKQEVYLAMLSGTFGDDGLADSVQEIRKRLAAGDRGITPFHWDLEFPEVFSCERGGFDVFVGNPPFAGDSTFTNTYPDGVFDWLKLSFPESSGRCDLVAFFFRQCYEKLRESGVQGLIATNTISQGDTRESGLRYICSQGGQIISAIKRKSWPGVASVVVSIVHLSKGKWEGSVFLDGREISSISAFLFQGGGSESPKILCQNAGKSFLGSKIYGQGFVFENSPDADPDRPGAPSPMSVLHDAIRIDREAEVVIKPYIGGEEVSASPTQTPSRYVIDFRDMPEELCWVRFPFTMEIAARKVKPERQRSSLSGDFVLRSPLPQRWWQHADMRPALYTALAGQSRVLVTPKVQSNFAFVFMNTGLVFSEQVVLLLESEFSCLQTRSHEIWVRFLGSTLGDGLRYTPTDCFETFPFPTALLVSAATDPTHKATRQNLEAIGERYHQFRAQLMVANNEGLTSTYNRFHDPSETSPGLLELRRLHGEMDQAVLDAYGWNDVAPPGPLNNPCGFGLDYLDLEEDAQLPDDLQERIDSGELFFWEADVACAFEAQVRAYGAVKGKKKFPWRYRWPDDVREDVLARLLALNAERYAEEVALGLHGKGAKKAGGPAATGGKRRGRPPKAAQASETGGQQTENQQTEQMGLGL